MSYPFKIQAFFFLSLFIPVTNFVFGHTKTPWLGMGEPLPKLVASQWSKWCSGQGYAEMDFGQAIHTHWYNEVNMPSQWLHATDDDIATRHNVKDMLRVYPNIQAEIITLHPQALGYNDIGHMKFFTPKYKKLWTYALDWLNSHR